jgi:lipoprotein-anchoring transpeptidase ErfK/SrfK
MRLAANVTAWGWMRSRRFRSGTAVAVLVVLFAVSTAGAPVSETPDAVAAERESGIVSAPAAASKPITMALTPAQGAVDVAPADPVTVVANGGSLLHVQLTGQDGRQVAGELAPDGTRWRSTEPLGYGKTYTTTATGLGSNGVPMTVSSTYQTVRPSKQATVSMNPVDGQTVGVGQPLAFYFSTAIADKVAAEKAIRVRTEPAVEGAFHWFSDKEVHWRPKDFWATGTRISVEAGIYGRHLGKGVFGKDDRRANITIGNKVVAVADGGTHQMSVHVNDQLVRTIPISMGKRAHETPNGTYVVMSEQTNYTMDSSTYGVPVDSAQGYRTTVDVASRMSNSGVFYHSAPWSVGDQGRRNVSHGCINMSTEAARWMQEIGSKGDLIIVQNSGGDVLEFTDGFGDWQIPWDQWINGGKR